MRIAVGELSEPSGPWPLHDLVRVAVAISSGDELEFIQPEGASRREVDAVIWERGYKADPAEFVQAGSPMAQGALPFLLLAVSECDSA